MQSNSGGTERHSLHTGEGEVVVSNWRTSYCSVLCAREAVCWHANRPLYMRCGPVSFAGWPRTLLFPQWWHVAHIIHTSTPSLTSHRTVQCRARYVTDEFIVSNRKCLQTVRVKCYAPRINWQSVKFIIFTFVHPSIWFASSERGIMFLWRV